MFTVKSILNQKVKFSAGVSWSSSIASSGAVPVYPMRMLWPSMSCKSNHWTGIFKAFRIMLLNLYYN